MLPNIRGSQTHGLKMFDIESISRWSFRETTVRGTPSVEKRPFCMVLETTDAGFHIIWRFQLRQILTHRIHVCYLW
jgi:hypothetical protein